MKYPTLNALSEESRRKLESLLLAFDQSWSPDALVRVQDKLSDHDATCRNLALHELVKIDLERQWIAGNQPLLESYLKRFPELGSANAISSDLILAEYEARKVCSESIDLAQFEKRFPNCFQSLKRRIEGTSHSADDHPDQSLIGTRSKKASATNGSNAQTASTEPPREFGRYRVIKKLGEGAMGSVYLAEDTKLLRKVALKTPRLDADTDASVISRFIREAQAAAGLRHRNICPVYDVGELQGVRYISMAFIEGRPLSAYVRKDRQQNERTVALLVQKLARALYEAHCVNVVHRDLKPANIMVDGNHEPIIMDFGLAGQAYAFTATPDTTEAPDAELDSRLTRYGTVLGTPAYMSPEQARGETEKIGPLSDVYSLGVILYQLLTGKVPFKGHVVKVLQQVSSKEPARPSAFRDDLSPELESICLRMMSKQVADRPATMQVVADELSAFLRGPKPSEEEDAFEPSEASDERDLQAMFATGNVAPSTDNSSSVISEAPATTSSTSEGRLPVVFGILAGLGVLAVILGVVIFLFGSIRGPGMSAAKTEDAVINSGTDADALPISSEWGSPNVDSVIEPETSPMALEFDGSGGHVMAPFVPLDQYETFTVEAWIKDWSGVLLCLGADGDPENSFVIRRFDNHIYLFGEYGQGETQASLWVNSRRPDGWEHLAITYDGSRYLIFSNGQLQNPIAPELEQQDDAVLHPLGPLQSSRLIRIGQNRDERKLFAVGLLRSLRISDSARYRDDFDPSRQFESDNSTQLLLDGSEFSGVMLRDRSSHQRHATLYGAKAVSESELEQVQRKIFSIANIYDDRIDDKTELLDKGWKPYLQGTSPDIVRVDSAIRGRGTTENGFLLGLTQLFEYPQQRLSIEFALAVSKSTGRSFHIFSHPTQRGLPSQLNLSVENGRVRQYDKRSHCWVDIGHPLVPSTDSANPVWHRIRLLIDASTRRIDIWISQPGSDWLPISPTVNVSADTINLSCGGIVLLSGQKIAPDAWYLIDDLVIKGGLGLPKPGDTPATRFVRTPGTAPSPTVTKLADQLADYQRQLDTAITNVDFVEIDRLHDLLTALPAKDQAVVAFKDRVSSAEQEMLAALPPKERDTKTALDRAISRLNSGDDFGAYVMVAGMEAAIRDTDVWKRRQDVLNEILAFKQRFPLTEQDGHLLSVAPGIESYLPVDRKFVATLKQRHEGAAFGVVRVFVENEFLDQVVNATINRSAAYAMVASEHGYGSSGKIQSGDYLYIFNTRENIASVDLYTARHRKTTIELDLSEKDYVFGGAVMLRQARDDELGELTVQVVPEPGHTLADFGLDQGQVWLSGGQSLTLPIGPDGRTNPIKLFPHRHGYHIHATGDDFASSRRNWDVKLRARKSATYQLMIAKKREVTLQWFHRKGHAGPWSTGTTVLETDDAIHYMREHWGDHANRFWIRLKIGEDGCTLEQSSQQMFQVPGTQWPPTEDIAAMSPKRSDSRKSFLISEGDTFSVTDEPNDKNSFQAMIRIQRMKVANKR